MRPEPRSQPPVEPDVRERVRRLMLERLALDPPSATTDLFENGLLDSLGLVDLLAALEEEFEMRIDFDDLEFDNFATTEAIAAYVSTTRAPSGRDAATGPRLVTVGEARPRS